MLYLNKYTNIKNSLPKPGETAVICVTSGENKCPVNYSKYRIVCKYLYLVHTSIFNC